MNYKACPSKINTTLIFVYSFTNCPLEISLNFPIRKALKVLRFYKEIKTNLRK